MEKENNSRIKEGLGWVEVGKSIDGEYRVEMLREKINIWKPKKDRILRVTKIDKNDESNKKG